MKKVTLDSLDGLSTTFFNIFTLSAAVLVSLGWLLPSSHAALTCSFPTAVQPCYTTLIDLRTACLSGLVGSTPTQGYANIYYGWMDAPYNYAAFGLANLPYPLTWGLGSPRAWIRSGCGFGHPNGITTNPPNPIPTVQTL